MFGRKKSPAKAVDGDVSADFGVTQSAEDALVQASDVAEFVTPGQRKMALGAFWQFAASKKQAAAKIAALRKAKLRCMSVAVQGAAAESALVGALPVEYAKHWVGSLLMAQVIGAGVYMQRLDDGRYWVFAAADSLPLARHDRIVQGEAQAHEVLMGFMTDLGQTAIFGDCGGSQRPVQMCWEEVDDLIDSKRIPKAILKASAPHAAASLPLIVLGGFVGLVGSAAAAWMLLLPAPPAPGGGEADRLAHLMRLAQSEQEIASIRLQLRSQFDSQVDAQRKQVRAAPLSDQLQQVQTLLANMPRPGVDVRFVRMSCSMEVLEREQRWSCTPVVGASTEMGRVALLALARDPSQVQTSIDQGFAVRDSVVELALDPFAGSVNQTVAAALRPWPKIDALAWRAYVLDTLLAYGMGEGVSGSIEVQPDMVVRAGDFVRNGIALEGVRDVTIARIMRFNVTLPLMPRSLHVLHAALADRGARLHAFEIDASGRMVFGITLKQEL